MLKNILKLNGTKELSRNEQTAINGGAGGCDITCWVCYRNSCWISVPQLSINKLYNFVMLIFFLLMKCLSDIKNFIVT